MDRDLIDNIKQGRTASAGAAASAAGYLLPKVVATTTLSSAFDTRGFHGVVATFAIGIFGDAASTTVYTEAELQDSPDGVTYTAVPDANLLFPPGDGPRTGAGTAGTTAASGCFFNSNTNGAVDLSGIYSVGYLGLNRYLKVNVRLTSPTTGSPCAVIFTAGFPDYRPVNGNPT